MPFAWFVALRYLREGRMQTALILLGVSVGIGVIIFLAALIDGLQVSLIRKTLGSQAHIIVQPLEEIPRVLPVARDSLGDGPAEAIRLQKPAQRLRSINQWQQVAGQIRRVPGVTAVSPIVSGAGFAARGQASRSVALRGIEPESFDRIVNVSGRLKEGRFVLTGVDALIGEKLAADLGAHAGDKIRLITGDNRDAVFTITGVFDLKNQDVNQRWVLVSLRSGQSLLDLSGGASSLEVTVHDVFSADRIARGIAAATDLRAESWMVLNSDLLAGLRAQDDSRYMIQTFVVIAVALGIASVLVVSVVQKNREIGILRAMGTTRRQIMQVFLIQGAFLGFGGWVAGSLLGTVLALLFVAGPKNPDGTARFVVVLDFKLFAATFLLALLTGLAASVAPARRAAACDPAQVIHRG